MTQNLQQVCGDLVDRARAGDQNACAMLVEVGKSANLGSPKAIESKKIIEKYIKDNPPPKLNQLGGTDIDTSWTRKMAQYVGTVQAAFEGDDVGDLQPIIALLPFMQEYGITTLSNGPNLTNDIICCIGANFANETEEAAFKFGVANSDQSDKIKKNIAKLNRPAAYAVLIGCLDGEARRIQLVRNPKNPISILCKDAARELGEI